MPIVMQCAALGCETLTMGPLCIEHEQQFELERVFVRGRPFALPEVEAHRLVTSSNAHAPSLRRVSERPAVARLRR